MHLPIRTGIAVLGLMLATGRAEPVTDLLLRARHKQLVAGDLAGAEALYREALQDRSLGPAEQARIRVRIATCLVRRGRLDVAEPFLAERIYAPETVAPEVRLLARDLRDLVRRKQVRPAPPPAQNAAAERRTRFDRYMADARRAMDRDENAYAYLRALMARELFPENADARALVTELETRWSGAARFLADPLRFVRDWTATRITQVAASAEKIFREGVAHDGKGAFNLAEGRFRDAIRAIDACESAGVSDRLTSLRRRIEVYWREMRARTGRKPPEIPAVRHRTAPAADYLKALQAMLDMVSSPEREYRLLPVLARRTGPPLGWHSKPEGFLLLRSAPSRWTLAGFAREFLRRRVEPRTWSQPGNYLETAGGMLVARNHPRVLDKLEKELALLEKPPAGRLRARVLAVPVSDAAAAAFVKRFGPFHRYDRGGSPALVRAVPAKYSLDYLASFLRGQGATVHPQRDSFDVPITNGAAQTLLLARPLRTASGYGDASEGEFGVLLDVLPYRRSEATTFLLRVEARAPAPPFATGDGTVLPRFQRQSAEFLHDVPRGGTLAVAGLRDPFAAAAGRQGSLIVLWAAPAETAEATNDRAAGAEVSVRKLLLERRDDPGPRIDSIRGFVRRDPSDVLRERAAVLERLLTRELGAEAAIDLEQATLRVPPARREDAVGAVERLLREADTGYVVTVRARSVRSSVLQRWMTRERLKRFTFDVGTLALAAPPAPELLRGETESGLFSPEARITVRGLQAAHVLSSLTRTVEAAEGSATVAEGIRITVRPHTFKDRLAVELDLQTSVREDDRVGGTRLRGIIDLGDWRTPKTALISGIPHPKASRPERLTEIVVSIEIRRIP